MSEAYDVVVIGTGASGSTAAFNCRSAGLSVAVIDSHPIGGTCALRGCDPKKVLVGFSDMVAASDKLKGRGLNINSMKIDWPVLMAFKRTFTEPVSPSRQKSYQQAGISIHKGRAKFIDRNTLDVDSIRIRAKHFVICSGSYPMKLNVSGEEHISISDDFLELDELPKRIVFVGGGYISFEFAGIAARAGSEVTIIHRSKTALKQFDQDLVAWVLNATRESGIKIELETPLTSIEKQGSHLIVHTAGESGDLRLPADMVVHGAGRIPDIEDLDPESAGIDFNRNGVTVNEYLQSVSNSSVYAAGDAAATRGLPLTPVATIEGQIASTNLIRGNIQKPDYSGIPTVVFTHPPVAAVGLSEDQARNMNLQFRVNLKNTSAWYTSRRIGETHSGFKVLIEKHTERILGAHLFGPHAEEAINIFALAVRHNLTGIDLKNTVFSYPTSISDINYMLD
jgi:glutathione reductase (NADPH)